MRATQDRYEYLLQWLHHEAYLMIDNGEIKK